MKIELVKPDSIKPYDKNPRKNIHAIDLIKQSIKEFGFRQPIVVDEKNIILVGHTRLLASKELGLKEFSKIKDKAKEYVNNLAR